MSKKQNKKAALGKGIGALLSSMGNDPINNPTEPTNISSEKIEKDATGTVVEISLEKVEINPHQPRKNFDANALNELSESIAIHGIIQPITVRKMGDGTYQLISGERRLRASKIAKLETIPAYIREADDKAMQEMALIENLQREDLSPMEVATTYKLLIDKYELTQEELGKRVNKGRTSITQILSLLSLPPSIIEALNTQTISRGHAILLAREEDPALQLMLLNRVVNEKLSVRALEQAVANMKNPPVSSSNKTPSKDLSFEYQDVQNNLKKHFERNIKLKTNNKGKGQIVLPFESVKDMNNLLEKLGLFND